MNGLAVDETNETIFAVTSRGEVLRICGHSFDIIWKTRVGVWFNGSVLNSSSGSLIAVTGDGGVVAVDYNGRRTQHLYRGHRGPLVAIKPFCPDTVLIGGAGGVFQLSVETGSIAKILDGFMVSSQDVGASGELVVSMLDGAVVISIPGHSLTTRRMALQGRIWSISFEGVDCRSFVCATTAGEIVRCGTDPSDVPVISRGLTAFTASIRTAIQGVEPALVLATRCGQLFFAHKSIDTISHPLTERSACQKKHPPGVKRILRLIGQFDELLVVPRRPLRSRVARQLTRALRQKKGNANAWTVLSAPGLTIRRLQVAACWPFAPLYYSNGVFLGGAELAMERLMSKSASRPRESRRTRELLLLLDRLMFVKLSGVEKATVPFRRNALNFSL